MTKRKGTAGIVDAIRNGTMFALSHTANFISSLSFFDAAALGAAIGFLIGEVRL